MTETHRRWLCGLCQREWLHAQEFEGNGYRPWVEADGCPRCRSTDIALTKYTPEFVGGDIPRPDTPPLSAEQAAVAGVAAVESKMQERDWKRLAADSKDARHNLTIEMTEKATRTRRAPAKKRRGVKR